MRKYCSCTQIQCRWSFAQGFGCAYFYCHMGAYIWPQSLAAATTDWYGYQQQLNPGSLSASLNVTFTNESRLLLGIVVNQHETIVW